MDMELMKEQVRDEWANTLLEQKFPNCTKNGAKSLFGSGHLG